MLVLLLYAGLLVALGLAFRRSSASREDYFLASSNLPVAAVAATLIASWFGAASFMVTYQQAAEKGLAALWTIAVPAVATLAVIFLFAGRVRREEVLSLPHLFRRRYGPLPAKLTAFFLLLYLILLASSQLIAAAEILSTVLPFKGPYLLGLSALLVAAYVSTGGFRAVVLTDVVQLLFILAGLLFLLFRVDPGQVQRFLKPGGFFSDLSAGVLTALSFSIAWSLSPVAWQRVDAAGGPAQARKAVVLAAAGLSLLYLAVVVAGAGSGGKLSLASPVLLLALLSSVLSTLDSAVNSAAMVFVYDIAGSLKSSLNVPASVAVVMVSFLLSLRAGGILEALGRSSEIFGEVLFVPFLMSFIFRQAGQVSAIAAMAAGGTFFLLNSFLFHFWSWPFSLLPGMVVCFAGWVAGRIIDMVRVRG